MSSVGVIQRRVPWAALIALGITVAMAFFVDSAELVAQSFEGVTAEQLRQADGTIWVAANLFFSWVAWFGAAFALVSLVNVVLELLSRGGVSDQIVGVVGGIFFWFGVDTVNLILIPLAVEQLTL